MKKLLGLIVFTVIFVITPVAQVTAITGSISFVGDVYSWGIGTGTSSFINFNDPLVSQPPNYVNAYVWESEGTFSSALRWDPVTFYDFNATQTGQVLWSFSDGIKDYSLTMETIIFNPTNTLGVVNVTGTGYYSVGLDQTDATWSVTANQSGGSTSMSSSSASVPIPAAVWLFGSGIVGLVGFRRKSKK